MSEFGHAFDSAQRAYDNQMPPEDSTMETCDRCGREYDPEECVTPTPKGKTLCDDCVVALEAQEEQ